MSMHTRMEVRGPKLPVCVALIQAVVYLRSLAMAQAVIACTTACLSLFGSCHQSWKEGQQSAAHMQEVNHDVDGVVLLGQTRPKSGQQGPQRTLQRRPRTSLDELL